MRLRGTAAAAAVVLLAACTTAEPGAESTPTPQPLPAVTVAGFDGGEGLDLSSVRGPALVNFWASWCGPCREEMPVLQRFHERHPEVRVIGIDYLDPRTELAADLVAATGVTYPLYSDPDGELSGQPPLPNLHALPYTALVDEQGRMVRGEFVVLDDVAEVEDLVRSHLGEEALP